MKQGTYLMNGCAVSLVHLVKLINATDTFVSQNQGTALQHLCSHCFVFASIHLISCECNMVTAAVQEIMTQRS